MATYPGNLSPTRDNMHPPSASLMSLPAELRLPIYERLFRSANCLVVYNLYAELYHYLPGPPIDMTQPEAFAILRTCRQIREEASKFIFSEVEITVRVMDTKVPEYRPHLPPLGKAEDMYFWRFVKNLNLEVTLERGEGYKETLLQILANFTAQTLENGKHLERLNVLLLTPHAIGLPKWFPEIRRTLISMRVQGDVTIAVDTKKDEEMCLQLAEIIKGKKDAWCYH